jgi:Protein kinase domain
VVTAPDIPGHRVGDVLGAGGFATVYRCWQVGLSDFGLASIISARGEQTASREALTPAYSSPETFRGEEPTVLADVYSLSATLYALLAGRPPRFAADGRRPGLATIMSLHDRPVEDVPGTPPELMALLRAGLSPDPAARPQSAAALRDALTDPRRYAAAAPGGYTSQASAPAAARHGSQVSAPQAARHVSPGPAAREPGATGFRWRVRHLALAAGLVVIMAAGLLIGARFLPHGSGPAAGPAGAGPARTGPAGTGTGSRAPGGGAAAADMFGIRTTSAGCPAARRVAAARCPASPECFGGLVVSAGSATAEPVACNRSHYWETFAIAMLPATVRTFDQDTVAADPAVRTVCSRAVMLASRRGQARRLPGRDWRVGVLPPSEAAFGSGTRVYRCLANETGHQPSVSQFGR